MPPAVLLLLLSSIIDWLVDGEVKVVLFPLEAVICV